MCYLLFILFREDRPILDEHVMESVSIPNSAKSTRYIVGVLRDGKVHLTALKSIVEMKDSFYYLDAADENKKKSKFLDEKIARFKISAA